MPEQLTKPRVKPAKKPSRTFETSEKFTGNRIDWSILEAKNEKLSSGELVFMLSVSTIWFFAFFYSVLYIFT